MSDKNASSLASEVWSESELLSLLDIDQSTLDELRRERSFPYCRLSMRKRIYLAGKVLAWLEQHQYQT